ncbi:hypothetical protein [Psychroserpens damuponensis]|uniref:hypothetical protein n=1 Tax=Psychroserpens damuponensis TaxID=943936 RepID=UPI0005901D28|nr:hypothetical protein [Psychroserpens damuponensis]
MTKQLLHHDEDYQQRFIKKIEAIPELLEAVKSELTAQKVDHKLKLSDLKDGNFVTIFEDYQKKKMQQRIPEADFEQWLILCNIDTDELTELENRYKKLLDIKHYFYTQNHDYWFSKETYEKNFERVSHPEAPTKKEYCIDDFLSILKDSYKITVDSEFFKLYATNQNQIDKISSIEDFVKASRKMKNTYADVLTGCGKCVKSLDRDLKSYELNYNAILDIK